MCMRDAADGRESAIERGVRRKIGRRTQVAFDNFAVKIGDDHVLRLHAVIRNAAGLDDDQTFRARNAAGIAESGEHEVATDQVQIGFEHFGS